MKLQPSFKSLMLLLSAIMPYLAGAQSQASSSWHVVVVDSASRQAIYKATIKTGSKQYCTGVNGDAVIEIGHSNENRGVEVSSVGYVSLMLLQQHVFSKYPDTIKLKPSLITLREVKISGINPDISIGDKLPGKRVKRMTSPNVAFAQFIPNTKDLSGTITSITYSLNDRMQGIQNPFRARLFTKNSDSITLGIELTNDTIIVYNSERKPQVTVDVSKYNIQLPRNGVIAVFETLDTIYYSKDTVWVKSNAGYGERPGINAFIRTPGINMYQAKNNWGIDSQRLNRTDSYAMVGPPTGHWYNNEVFWEWYVYLEGNNFAISITVNKMETNSKL